MINWVLLGNSMLASFLTGTSNRIFVISLPTVAHYLGTDILGVSLALISFQLSTTSLSIVFGKLGDLYGRQKVFGAGFLVFTVSSLLCGLSQNVLQLVLFRLLQGMGAAMTQSQGRALAMDSVSESAAGKAQGFMTTAYHTGFLLGPSLGGLIIDYIHWRGIFLFLVPIGAIGAVLTWVNRKRSPVPVLPAGSGGRPSIDYVGAILLVALTLALIAVLDRRVKETVGAPWWAGGVVVFAALFLGFLLRERTALSPILNLSLFKNRMFAFSSLSLLLVSINHSMTSFILPFYLQEVLHLSPSFMGVLFMSAPVFTVTLSPVGGYISDRVGPRIPATAGVVLFGVAVFLGALLRVDSHWLLPALMLGLTGLATAMFFPPNHAALIGSVPREYRGVATGALYVMFGLGNIVGISLGNFLMTVGFRTSTGLETAVPTPAHPGAFVAALNFTFLVAVGICLVAVVGSLLRGASIKTTRESSPS